MLEVHYTFEIKINLHNWQDAAQQNCIFDGLRISEDN